MELEIIRTMNGYDVKEKDNGLRSWSFESTGSLLNWIKDFLPKEAEGEIKVTD
jgi:hypothetical protein